MSPVVVQDGESFTADSVICFIINKKRSVLVPTFSSSELIPCSELTSYLLQWKRFRYQSPFTKFANYYITTARSSVTDQNIIVFCSLNSSKSIGHNTISNGTDTMGSVVDMLALQVQVLHWCKGGRFDLLCLWPEDLVFISTLWMDTKEQSGHLCATTSM